MDRENSSTAPLKTEAKALRKYLAEQGIELKHGKCLEAVARMHGFKNWDTACASLREETPQGATNWRLSTRPSWNDAMLEDPESEWACVTLPDGALEHESVGVILRDDGVWVPRNYEASLLLLLSRHTEYPDGAIWVKEG